jgi:hypothetical protein
MLELSEKWGPRLTSQPESGMGYWIVTVKLKDGREFRHATIVGGVITRIRDQEGIPFTEGEISDLVVDTNARR